MPMTKLAVSTGHGQFGIIFWQLVLVSLIMLLISAFQSGKSPVGLRHLRLLLVVALFGTIISNSMSYIAASHVPSGVMSIVMSLVPMSALPIALLWRSEVFDWRRLSGLVFGALAMVLLVGPDASLPDPSAGFFVLVAALSTICYGFEGNYVARFGLDGLDPIQVLLYSSLLGIILITPLAIGTGQFYNPFAAWSVAENALLVSSFAHALAYAGYIWLVGIAGAVFAAQISYLVTVSGVLSAMVILDERYSGFIWLSLGLVLIGLFLVQPNRPQKIQT